MTLRSCRWCILLLLASIAACRSSAPSAAQDAQPTAARWSDARELTDARGRTRALWAPSLAVWNDQLVLVGNDVNLESMVGRGSLGAINLAMDGRPRALDSLFGLYPRVAVSPRTGTRHLIWAEHASRDSIVWLTPARSLWWSTISQAGEWSLPSRILAGVQVHWAPTMSSPPVFGVDGTLHAAVAVWSATTGNQVVHLALDSSRWRITPVQTGTAMYTAIGIADNGDLAVAWVAQAQEPGGPPNAAHVAFSEDQGRSWTPAMRLDTAMDEASGQLRLIGLDDAFLVLWGQYGAATFPLASIRRAIVRAGSHTVVRLPAIDPGYPIYGPETVRDSCGTAHLVVRHLAAASTHADYTPLSHGIDTLQHVDPATPVSEVDIASAAGTLTLAWVGRTGSGEFKSQVRTRPVLCGRQ